MSDFQKQTEAPDMKLIPAQDGASAEPYVPQAGDFEYLDRKDINTDRNYASQGYWKSVFVHFFHNARAVIGLIIIVVLILFAVFAPIVSQYSYRDQVMALDPNNMNRGRVVPKEKPGVNLEPRIPAIHELLYHESYDDIWAEKTLLFGTDSNGRDLWTRVWFGARVSLIIAFVTIFIDMIIGMSYGLLSGYFGGVADNIMQRFVEIANSIPRLVIVAVLATLMPKGIGLVIVALLLTEWIGMSKIARAEMMKMKNQEYVLASRTLGAGNLRVIFREILPNTIGPIITQMMFSIPTAIFTEAFLSFVGVGIVPPECSVGSLIADGFNNIKTQGYQIVAPIIVLSLLMLGFNFIGDGLREALAPKLEDM